MVAPSASNEAQAWTVTGPVTITGNTGTLPPPLTGTVHATGNTITGPARIQSP